jgi:hypothetical protein
MIRADSGGATHGFPDGCRARGVGFSIGLAVDERAREAILRVPEQAWVPAIGADGQLHDNGAIVELTALLVPP